MAQILPTFLIPGAGKSGTSYIAEMLGAHNEVFIPYSKEPAFFSTLEGIGWYEKGIQFYYKNFVDYCGEKEIGEASTVYMYDPESPKLIKKDLGDIKLIFILRNPVDRLYSNYWQEIKAGNTLPDFETLIRSNGKLANHMKYIGFYNLHLERYFRLFPKKNILVLFHDDLREDPSAVFETITTFLNIEKFPAGFDFGKKSNPASLPRSKMVTRLLRNRSSIQKIKEHLPEKMLPYAKKVLASTRKLFQKPYSYPKMDDSIKEYLYNEYKPSIIELEKLLKVNLQSWKNYKGL